MFQACCTYRSGPIAEPQGREHASPFAHGMRAEQHDSEPGDAIIGVNTISSKDYTGLSLRLKWCVSSLLSLSHEQARKQALHLGVDGDCSMGYRGPSRSLRES